MRDAFDDEQETVRLGDGGCYSHFMSALCRQDVVAHGMVLIPERLLGFMPARKRPLTLILTTDESAYRLGRRFAEWLHADGQAAELVLLTAPAAENAGKWAKSQGFCRRYLIDKNTVVSGIAAVFVEGRGWTHEHLPLDAMSS